MKKIQFSVWPAVKFNGPLPDVLMSVRDKLSLKVLQDAGFETVIRTDIDESDPILAMMLPHAAPNVRWFTKISDYVRLKYIKEYLDAGYDEILYTDLDMVITEAPKSFGVAYEMHLQTTSGDGTGPITKFWSKGVNCTYYINQSHRPQFEEHLKNVTADIIAAGGNPKFCYPANSMWMMEEGIGHIQNWFHFGSFKEPDFCTVDNIIQCLTLYTAMYGKIGDVIPQIKAVNAMGTRDLAGLTEEVDKVFAINKTIEGLTVSEEMVRAVVARFEPNVRIRPNYNSQDSRKIIWNLIQKYKA
ncbi:hypothetical protein [Ralstonia phage RP13]|nr:hypothetical protein [Ralstonia phage RP13]